MTLACDPFTAWVVEPLIKEKKDIDLIGPWVTAPKCDVEEVNRRADEFGERGLVRGYICCFDVFGQPGTWQDATCLVGIERLILEAHDDPGLGPRTAQDSAAPQEDLCAIAGRGPATTFWNWAAAGPRRP